MLGLFLQSDILHADADLRQQAVVGQQGDTSTWVAFISLALFTRF